MFFITLIPPIGVFLYKKKILDRNINNTPPIIITVNPKYNYEIKNKRVFLLLFFYFILMCDERKSTHCTGNIQNLGS